MKKIKRKIVIIFTLTILILANIVSAVTIHNSVNKNEVEVGDQLEFTIDFKKIYKHKIFQYIMIQKNLHM